MLGRSFQNGVQGFVGPSGVHHGVAKKTNPGHINMHYVLRTRPKTIRTSIEVNAEANPARSDEPDPAHENSRRKKTPKRGTSFLRDARQSGAWVRRQCQLLATELDAIALHRTTPEAYSPVP